MWKILCILAASVLFASGHVIKRQAHPGVRCDDAELDISFIVDASASIWPQNFTVGLWFMQNFVDLFDIGPNKVRVSMVTYGDKVYEEDAFGFNSHLDKESLRRAIDGMPYPSGTATETGMAIRWFLENQEPEARQGGIRSVVIVLTDGLSQRPMITKAEAENAVNRGLEVFAIGVGHSVSPEELHNIASDRDHVFQVNDYRALDEIKHSLAVEACGIQPQRQCQDRPLDISFIVDASASIWPQNFTVGLKFMENFVDIFDIGPNNVRVSMVTYGDRVYEENAFGFRAYNDKRSLRNAIDRMPYPSGTATETGMAIKWFLENQEPEARQGSASIVIVLTDGLSQRPMVTKTEAEKAINRGLEVFAIGVGHSVSPEELHNIASDDSHVFQVDDYKALDDIKHRLAFEACGFVPDPEPVCQSVADICFVLDSSRSIQQENFTIELEFVREFLNVFDISSTSTRVAAVMYGDRVYDERVLNFDQFNTKQDTLNAVLAMPYMHGASTETGEGIEYMIDNFLPRFRPSAAHIGIIITDGQSQKWMYTRRAAQKARDRGITTVAVGVGKIGSNLDQEELDNIAGDRSRVMLARDFAQLNTLRDQLIDITCS